MLKKQNGNSQPETKVFYYFLSTDFDCVKNSVANFSFFKDCDFFASSKNFLAKKQKIL
jgi:hypothetical protein